MHGGDMSTCFCEHSGWIAASQLLAEPAQDRGIVRGAF